MSFNLSGMERGAFCHDRCVCLLLADHVWDVGAAGLNARPRFTGSVHIVAGFGDIEKVLRNIPDKKIFALSRKQQYNHFI